MALEIGGGITIGPGISVTSGGGGGGGGWPFPLTFTFNSLGDPIASDGTLSFSSDGTVVLVGGLRAYTMTTPWDVTTITGSPTTYNTTTLGIDGWTNVALGGVFSNNGTKVCTMAIDGNADVLRVKYNLDTPYDLSSASSYSSQVLVGEQFSQFSFVAFNQDGTKAYARNYLGITTWSLPVAYDWTSASATFGSPVNITSALSIGQVPNQIAFSPDGLTALTAWQGSTDTGEIVQFEMTSESDLSTIDSGTVDKTVLTNGFTYIDKAGVYVSNDRIFVAGQIYETGERKIGMYNRTN